MGEAQNVVGGSFLGSHKTEVTKMTFRVNLCTRRFRKADGSWAETYSPLALAGYGAYPDAAKSEQYEDDLAVFHEPLTLHEKVCFRSDRQKLEELIEADE